MIEITNKEIKRYILDPTNDLDELFDLIEEDSKQVIEGVFNSLFTLSKNYTQNKSRVDYLLYFLKEFIELKEIEELNLLIGPIIDFQNKISKWNIKERIKVKNISLEIQNIFNNIQVKLTNKKNNDTIKCLEFLILYNKNSQMIENFLNEHDNILTSKNEEDIFSTIIKKYLESENVEEAEYFYHIILTFLNSKQIEKITKNKEKYLKTISNSKINNIENANNIIELLNSGLSITLSQLEERYGIQFNFPEIILDEINNFKPKQLQRKDFTNQECITIDGKNSICLDDAINIEKNNDDTYTLTIHITDIPSFIPFNTMTREEASYRNETLYLKDTNLLLYPNIICDEICSLIPPNYKKTISYIFKLDSNYNIIPNTLSITPGIIKVVHKLTYEEADERINKPQAKNLDNQLQALATFADIKRKSNNKKEIYREYENLMKLEPNHESLKINTSISANIIHESMILVNYEVAKYFKKSGLPYIYRKLNVPGKEFIEEQVKKIKSLGLNISEDKSFISQLKDSYIESTYCSEPTFHQGLKLDCYSHSTSPARRYMDSLGQYIIHDLIINNNLNEKNINIWQYRIDRAIQYANDKTKKNEMFVKEYNYLYQKKLVKRKINL